VAVSSSDVLMPWTGAAEEGGKEGGRSAGGDGRQEAQPQSCHSVCYCCRNVSSL